jgi:cell pole-organizing protein PopZ
MTQAAKAQEPSMEEILASIRRIIADDDVSKPAKAPEQASPAKPAATTPGAATAAPGRPSPTPATPSKPAAAATPSPPKAAPPTAAVANSQDEIDAMLAELDAPPKAAGKSAAIPSSMSAPTPAPMPTPMPTTSPTTSLPSADVLDLTESMTSPVAPPPKPMPGFQTIDGTSDVVFTTKAPEPMPERALISNETIAAVDSAFNSLAHTVIGQNARTLEDLVREMLRPMLKSWLDDNLPGMVERIVRAEIERVSRGRP